MSDFEEQIRALSQRMEARHLETLAKMEALRGETRSDLKAFREEVVQAFEHHELRSGARLEGLEAVLKDEINGLNTDLSMLYGLVTNVLQDKTSRDVTVTTMLSLA